MKLKNTPGFKIIHQWLAEKEFIPFAFQEETWQHIVNRKSGLVNAPTGCGKTFSVFLGAVINFINENPESYQTKNKNGLQLLWITPLRALAKDIGRAMEEVIAELGMNWQVGIRNGDTTIAERAKQKRNVPEVLIITPESLHLLLAQKNYPDVFKTLQIIAVDEWHELLGSKRGVQVELALSIIISLKSNNSKPTKNRNFSSALSVWGISATIGNLDQAREVLLSPLSQIGLQEKDFVTVTAKIDKPIKVESIFPDEIENYPWAGHLGIKLVDKVIPIILESRTTLIFINTRGMSEMWYQALLRTCPDLAGAIALHHGSIDQALRFWVEENLHTGNLKAVVCTASLDLGVDFRPVETVIQVGSPKGVARFLQRAGRSGHRPGEVSKIYFLPTHSLELVEAAALKDSIDINLIENREPRISCYDVLIQYLSTLAISDGFYPANVLDQIRSTYCYREITDDEWLQILQFVTAGGVALQQYDDYKKMEVVDGLYKINSRRIAMRHRMHIGTIVSDPILKVKFLGGGYVGVIEEWFVARMKPGDVFTLSGRTLEFVMIKDMTCIVRKSSAKKSMIPSWQGGRMPLSANLGFMLRKKFDEAGLEINNKKIRIKKEPELAVLEPLFELQNYLSHIPKQNELLIEQIETKDGFHLFVFPFEGRLVHEAMAAVLAYRLSLIRPISFSFAMNDYGFELLSDQPIPLDNDNAYTLFSPENLFEDIQRSVNSAEMAKRKFRDIAVIGGLIFQGFPGEQKKARHLQSSASLLFNVFSEYEPNNLLMRQAYNEVMEQQMEEQRLRDMLERIQKGKIIITYPRRLTPFCFPIKVDSMREDLSSEKLEERVKRMQLQLEK
ncbi:MAG TPA: ligase-associated DNA damage response DEXH box helicase [Hanamia sp.]|nr:ligase-associated DNA damage response DEXH box helicase [Hanamia sp.]